MDVPPQDEPILAAAQDEPARHPTLAVVRSLVVVWGVVVIVRHLLYWIPLVAWGKFEFSALIAAAVESLGYVLAIAAIRLPRRPVRWEMLIGGLGIVLLGVTIAVGVAIAGVARAGRDPFRAVWQVWSTTSAAAVPGIALFYGIRSTRRRSITP